MIYAFILIFTILLIVSIKLTKSIFSFPSFFIIFFSLYLIVSYFFTYEYYDYTYLSFTFFTVLFIAILLGFVLKNIVMKKRGIEDNNKENKPFIYYLSKNVFRLILFVIFLLALANVYFNVRFLGFGIKDLLSLSKIMSINRKAAELRYAGYEVSNIYISITLPFVYLLPLFLGFNLAIKFNIKNLILAGFSFIPALMIVLILNTKAVFIGVLVFFLASFLVGWLANKKNHLKITLRLLIAGIILIVAFVAIMMISFGLRAGSISLNTLVSLKEKFIDYAFAGIPAFDKWLATYSFRPNLYGQYTFISFWNILGVAEKTQGGFQEYVEFGPFVTNIYTAFRGLVEDFGITGTIIIGALMGYASNGLEYRIKNSNNGVWISLYTLIYSFFIFALFISMFTYTSFILAFIAYLILVIIWPRGDKNEYQSLL